MFMVARETEAGPKSMRYNGIQKAHMAEIR